MRGIKRIPYGVLFFTLVIACTIPGVFAGCGVDTNPYDNVDDSTSVGYYPPVVSFYGVPLSGNAPLTVNFFDSSLNGPKYWSWNFGDGTSSNLQNPVHEYVSPGSYTVSLTAGNGYGGNSLTKKAYIVVSNVSDSLVVNFNANSTTGTTPLTVEFTDTSPGDEIVFRTWTFTSGSNTVTDPGTGKTLIHTFTAPGSYDVRLEITTGANVTAALVKSAYILVTKAPAVPGQTEGINITLEPGWNLVSSPQKLDARTDQIGEVFGNVNTGSHSIYKYNAQSGQFIPCVGTSVLNPWEGIWIYSTYRKNITLIYDASTSASGARHLYQGWNLVGYPMSYPGNAREAFGSLGNSWTTILRFDSQVQGYPAAIFNEGAGGQSDQFLLSANEGLWIYLVSPSDLSI